MRRLLVLFPLLFTVAFAACGEDEGSSTASGADRSFAKLMIPHHESAIAMARVAQERAESDFVRELAADITGAQQREIATLKAADTRLAAAGLEVGDLGVPGAMQGMDGDTASLKTADPFDEAFIRLMVPHHRGAVEMAKAELERGGDGELRSLAQDIIEAQEREIAAMEQHLGQPVSGAGHGSTHSG